MNKLELEKVLNEGKTIYLKGSNASEKRLYRLNNKLGAIEYSDNNKDWKQSNMKLENLKDNEWVIFE